jgi:hypothetical protein
MKKYRTPRARRVKPRKRKMSKHHLTARSQGGTGTPENILNLWRDRHDLWHVLFGNNSLEQIILILQRIVQMKRRGLWSERYEKYISIARSVITH